MLQCCYKYIVLNTLNHLQKHLMQIQRYRNFLCQHIELKLYTSKKTNLLQHLLLSSNYHMGQIEMCLCKGYKNLKYRHQNRNKFHLK